MLLRELPCLSGLVPMLFQAFRAKFWWFRYAPDVEGSQDLSGLEHGVDLAVTIFDALQETRGLTHAILGSSRVCLGLFPKNYGSPARCFAGAPDVFIRACHQEPTACRALCWGSSMKDGARTMLVRAFFQETTDTPRAVLVGLQHEGRRTQGVCLGLSPIKLGPAARCFGGAPA